MIAHVPTMAIEKVYFSSNDGVIVDEALAGRVGLIPIHADPRLFEQAPLDESDIDKRELAPDTMKIPSTDRNTLVFDVNVKCDTREKPGKFTSFQVLSSHFCWVPQGDQIIRLLEAQLQAKQQRNSHSHELIQKYWQKNAKEFARKHKDSVGDEVLNQQTENISKALSSMTNDQDINLQWDKDSDIRFGIRPVLPNILLAKLASNQQLSFTAHAVKGYGYDHAKFSPVSCCSYRLLPEIRFKNQGIKGDLEFCEKFQNCFAKGVIGIREISGQSRKKSKTKQYEAFVQNARNDTVSRECLRHPEFADKVELGRVRDHFIYHVESLGQYRFPSDIFIESTDFLARKCLEIKQIVDEIRQSPKSGHAESR